MQNLIKTPQLLLKNAKKRALIPCLRHFSQDWSAPDRNEENLYVWRTHKVENVVEGDEKSNLYLSDRALAEILDHFLPKGSEKSNMIAHLINHGNEGGTAHARQWADEANMYKPRLQAYDRVGQRLDQVSFHHSYHELVRMGVENEVVSYAWRRPGTPGAQIVRAACCYIQNQVDPGATCAASTTFSATPVLKLQPEIWADYKPLVNSRHYDPRDLPLFEKKGALIGVAMTEKQGGSDVRANTTTAKPVSPNLQGPGAVYTLRGHKWFCSAPMSDAMLTVAYGPNDTDQPSCFLVPRWMPDGAKNTGLQLARLKNKLGDHSNATAEIELNNAWAMMIGPAGQGLNVLMQMVHHSRLECALTTAAQMRAALRQAVHYVSHRRAFGQWLVRAPAMVNLLGDLATESEAATIMVMRLAQAFDESALAAHTGSGGGEAKALQRIITPLTKYWLAKRQPAFTAECMECLGGNGYTEDFGVARLYRQAPLNAVWEGTSHVMCMDVFRAAAKYPDALPMLFQELEAAHGLDSRVDGAVASLKREVREVDPAGGRDPDPAALRHLCDRMATALQGSLMVRYGNADVAQAFCSRLERKYGANYGSYATIDRLENVIERCIPELAK